MDVYYKLTNVGTGIIRAPWTKGLLNAEDKARYEEYLLSPEYLGESEEERQNRKKIPEAIKAQGFFAELGKGMLFAEYPQIGGMATKVERYFWFLAPDYEAIKKDESALYLCRDLCQQYKIAFNADDEVDALIEKLKKKFGSNVTVLTKAQAEDSGLKRIHERVEIIQKKRSPYDDVTQKYYKGNIIFKEITPSEAEAIMGELPKEVSEEVTELKNMKRDQLIALAKTRGIKQPHLKSTLDLIELLA